MSDSVAIFFFFFFFVDRSKNIQCRNRLRFGDNKLWISYREQSVGPSNARFEFIGQ